MKEARSLLNAIELVHVKCAKVSIGFKNADWLFMDAIRTSLADRLVYELGPYRGHLWELPSRRTK